MAQRLLPLIKEFHYEVVENTKNEDFIFSPPDPTLPKLHFIYVRDELTRASLFMGDRADVLFDTLSLAKTSWLKKRGAQIVEAKGFTLSFIGFQLKDPILKDLRVRQAIPVALTPDPAKANRSLNEAAMLFREAMKPLGIEVDIMPIETSLFYTKLKSGNFPIFSGRIIRNGNDDPVSPDFRKIAPFVF